MGTRRKSLKRNGLILIFDRIGGGVRQSHSGRGSISPGGLARGQFIQPLWTHTEDHVIRPLESPETSVMRRIGALFYDALLLLAVLMVANALVVIPYEVINGHPIYESFVFLTLMRIYLLASSAPSMSISGPTAARRWA
jgi:hypothetical protein